MARITGLIALLFLTILFMLPITAWGGQVTLPHTFQSGQPALASEVNGNFVALRDAINENTGALMVKDGNGQILGLLMYQSYTSLKIMTDKGYSYSITPWGSMRTVEAFYLSSDCTGDTFTVFTHPGQIVYVNDELDYIPKDAQPNFKTSAFYYDYLQNCSPTNLYAPIYPQLPNDPAITGVSATIFQQPITIDFDTIISTEDHTPDPFSFADSAGSYFLATSDAITVSGVSITEQTNVSIETDQFGLGAEIIKNGIEQGSSVWAQAANGDSLQIRFELGLGETSTRRMMVGTEVASFTATSYTPQIRHISPGYNTVSTSPTTPPPMYYAVPFVPTSSGVVRVIGIDIQPDIGGTHPDRSLESIAIFSDSGGRPGTELAASLRVTNNDLNSGYVPYIKNGDMLLDGLSNPYSAFPVSQGLLGVTGVTLTGGTTYWAVVKPFQGYDVSLGGSCSDPLPIHARNVSNDGVVWSIAPTVGCLTAYNPVRLFLTN